MSNDNQLPNYTDLPEEFWDWSYDPVQMAAYLKSLENPRSLALNLAADNWYDMGPKDRLTHVSEVLTDLASGEQPDAIQQLLGLLPPDVIQKLENALRQRSNGT